jgi:hypothetical protein
MASGTPGFNAGVALARWLWIAPLGDDDAFGPEHVERLLAHARNRRLEFVYGRIRLILPDGSESLWESSLHVWRRSSCMPPSITQS